jgi:hypothetical protein
LNAKGLHLNKKGTWIVGKSISNYIIYNWLLMMGMSNPPRETLEIRDTIVCVNKTILIFLKPEVSKLHPWTLQVYRSI